ncbi:SMI1/KNR4 family protein [Planosporangium sp. 12N6]|uniref:SMI1/KNR4 family protein n=1 Tax=Planosporangium spinosum TaxID=3402278 RepID=UPI003CFABACD
MDREFLERWSREWVVAHDPERDRPLDDEVRGGWLGFAPASPEQIAAAEERLGRTLPPSLRSFLLITDGWKNAGNFIYRLAGTAELEWLRDTRDAHWADAYRNDAYQDDEFPEDDFPDDGEVIGRSLRISLAGDASVLFLDPEDVGEDGEWAAYRLASWSGTGPERFDSFADLMIDLYAGFHALRKPPGETRDRWDAAVERARLAALRGELDEPAAVLAESQRFGRERAQLLRFQLSAMQGNWYTAPLSHVFLADMSVVNDPLFEAELLPLLFVEDRLTHRHDRFTLDRLRQVDRVRARIEEYEARLAEPDFRQPFGNPEFDRAVRAIVDDLAAAVPDPAGRAVRSDPVPPPRGLRAAVVRRLDSPPGFGAPGSPVAFQGPHPPVAFQGPHPPTAFPEPGPTEAERAEAARVRRALLDEAWTRLRAAMSTWRPVSDCHIAPVVLFTEPLLAKVLTPDRGRDLLRIPRG